MVVDGGVDGEQEAVEVALVGTVGGVVAADGGAVPAVFGASGAILKLGLVSGSDKVYENVNGKGK